MERGDDLWHKKVFRIFFYLVEKNILYVFIMVYIKKSTQDLYEFFRFTGLNIFYGTRQLSHTIHTYTSYQTKTFRFGRKNQKIHT